MALAALMRNAKLMWDFFDRAYFIARSVADANEDTSFADETSPLTWISVPGVPAH